MKKTFVTIFYPGVFVSETSEKEVTDREWSPDPKSLVYAWRFFDKEYADVNGEALMGKPKNFSPTYYYGTELTAAEAISQGNPIAKANIEINRYKRVVKTKSGQMFPIEENDIVVVPKL